MGGFFNMDGPFFKIGNFLADIFILSIVFILFSLPIFTIGASLSALYYVASKRVSDKEGYILKDFLKSFKMNFKQSTIVWLFFIFASFLIFLNLNFVKNMGSSFGFLYPVYLFMSFELFIVFIYIFALIARFDMPLKELFRNSFFMANRHLPTSVLCIVTFGGLLLASFVFPPFCLLFWGAYAFLSSFLLMRVFRKYRPEIDE